MKTRHFKDWMQRLVVGIFLDGLTLRCTRRRFEVSRYKKGDLIIRNEYHMRGIYRLAVRISYSGGY